MQEQLIYSIIGSVVMLTALFALHYYWQYKNAKNDNSELQIQKNNFETISKKANDIILTIDIVTGAIYDANLQAAQTLGYKVEELCTKTIHNLHPPELLDMSAKTIAEVWDKKGLVYQNLPFITAKGEKLDVECSAKVLIYNDKPVIIIYARDIRERLKMEREIKNKNDELEEKNKNIIDSISYASRIQTAVVGNPNDLHSMFADAFVLLKPHSIVSGDFYWFRHIGQYKIVIAADCTGHGVPGAFMTLLGNNFLDQIVDNNKKVMPDEILHELNTRISTNLNKEKNGEHVRDGMDMAVLTFDEKNRKIYYAGAKNPLLIVHNQQPQLIKASKHAIGGRLEDKSFQLHHFDLQPQTTFYIYSDGFQDQFGGDKNRKYMSIKFRNLLIQISNMEMQNQKQNLEEELNRWKGNNHQTDDILVIGIKV